MKSRVASSEIRINISNKQEVEISKKLEITIAIPKNVGSIQKVEVLINRYGEAPSIIQKMKITKEDNDFITYSTNSLTSCLLYPPVTLVKLSTIPPS